MRSKDQRSEGFALVEAVAAAAIASIVGAGLVAALQSASRSAQDARLHASALRLGEHLLNAGFPSSAGTRTGVSQTADGVLTWRIDRAALRVPSSPDQTTGVDLLTTQLDWTSGRRARSLTLNRYEATGS